MYPAHGAGAGAKNLSSETVSTLGEQKKANYALREYMTKEEFIKGVTDNLSPYPVYFPLNVQLNKEGNEVISEVIKLGTHALEANNFETVANDTKTIILDVRSQEDFAKGHIPNLIFIGIDASFATWFGALIGDIKQPILLVIPEGREEETITRLSRVGFDNTLGFLKGGFITWKKASKAYDVVNSISANEFKKQLKEKTAVYDIRKPVEYTSEHIK